MSAPTPKQLLFSILQYLNGLKQNYDEETQQSLEIGLECLAALENLDITDTQQQREFGMAQSLDSTITAGLEALQSTEFDRFVQLLSSRNFFADMNPGSPEYQVRLQQARSKFNQRFGKKKDEQTEAKEKKETAPKQYSPEDIKDAVALKAKGNVFMGQGKLDDAIDLYTQAIQKHPTAIYHANRAAALISQSKFEEAKPDCEAAIALDPSYAKAHYRLGTCLIKISLAQARSSFETALKLSSDSRIAADIKEQLKRVDNAFGKLPAKPASTSVPSTASASAPSSTPSPAPGGFDFASLMNNPMVQQMANNMMGGGGGGGMGGMDFGAMMNDPSIQSMMGNLMGGLGGMGGAAPSAPSSGSEAPSNQEAPVADATPSPSDDTPSPSDDTPPAYADVVANEAKAEVVSDPSDVSVSSASSSVPSSQPEPNASPAPSGIDFSALAGLVNDPSVQSALNDPETMNMLNNPEMLSQLAGMFGGLNNNSES